MQRKPVVPYSIVCSLLLAVLAGCSQPDTGPSYAELVVTYNAELEALDRLEAKREKLVAEYAAAVKPPPADTLSQLQGLLDSARELQGGVDVDTTDPDALLDQLAEKGEAAEDIASQLVDGLLGGQPEESEQSDDASGAPATPTEPTESTESTVRSAETAAAPNADLEALKAKYEAELAALDKEIADQKARVERARAARDAAEAAER